MGEGSGSGSPGGSEPRLRPDSAPFVPRQRDHIRPIRTAGNKRDVFASLDAVCFTPSQGVCTPSPTNMAAMWAPPAFQGPASPYAASYAFSSAQTSWDMLTVDYGSPGPSDSNASDASGYQTSGTPRAHSRPHTPHGAPLLFSSFFYPMPISPTALQLAAGGYPGTPTRGGPPHLAGGAAHGGFGPPVFLPGSPMVAASPGQLVFAQYFGGVEGPAAASQRGQQQQQRRPGSPSHMVRAPSGSSDHGGDCGIEVTPGAYQLAQAMIAAQNLQGEPPQQLLELASLLQTYGLVSAGAHGGGGSPDAKGSKVGRGEGSGMAAGACGGSLGPAPALTRCAPPAAQGPKRQKSQPKLNADESVRLNARQRRTLRRAQERAMKALVEMQQAAHGVDAEQAAAALAASIPALVVGTPSPPARGGGDSAPRPLAGSPGRVQQLHPIPPAYAAAGMLSPVASPPVAAGMIVHSSPFMAAAPPGGEFGDPGGYMMPPAPVPLPLPYTLPAPFHHMQRAGPLGARSAPGGGPRAPRLSRFAPAAGQGAGISAMVHASAHE
eukprot:scaffold4.g4972.t1